MDESDLKRLRWRCRRGLLENDLVLERFLELYGRDLTAVQLDAFNRLLDLQDKQIWDLVSKRKDPTDPALIEVVDMLRGCWRSAQ